MNKETDHMLFHVPGSSCCQFSELLSGILTPSFTLSFDIFFHCNTVVCDLLCCSDVLKGMLCTTTGSMCGVLCAGALDCTAAVALMSTVRNCCPKQQLYFFCYSDAACIELTQLSMMLC